MTDSDLEEVELFGPSVDDGFEVGLFGEIPAGTNAVKVLLI